MGIEAHRLIALGVSAYQDGPALSDQGTLTATQYPVAPRRVNATSTTLGACSHRVIYHQTGDIASYVASQHMPNAYFGPSKLGCYLPLRLSKDSEEYRTDATASQITSISDADRFTLGTTAGTSQLPYPAAEAAYMSSGYVTGDLVYKALNGNWGSICARNLSPATSFAFYFRITIECRVLPNSPLAPQQSVSPAYDPAAIANYYRISRELKDAYPVDYNDLGKLWEVIKGAVRTISGGLSFVPGPIGQIAGLVHGLVPAPAAHGPVDNPPAATQQRLTDAARAPARRPPTARSSHRNVKFSKAGRKGAPVGSLTLDQLINRETRLRK